MVCPGCGAPDDQGCFRNCPEVNMSKVGEPLDLTKELTDIKRRLEALEQKGYTIGREPRLGPSPDGPGPYDLGALADILKKVKKPSR